MKKSDFESVEELLEYILYHDYSAADISFSSEAVFVPDHNEPKIVNNAFFCNNAADVYRVILQILELIDSIK